MVTLVILIYLFVVSLYLFFGPAEKSNLHIKIRIKNLKCFNAKNNFFCSKQSKKYQIFKFLYANCVVFKTEKKFNKYCLPLKKVGIDYFKKIYKLELYKNFNFKEKCKEINMLKQLSLLYNNFYTFIFVDNLKTLEQVNNYLNQINFLQNVKVYYCLDVDYNLLSSINYFDVNLSNKSKNTFTVKGEDLGSIQNNNGFFVGYKNCNRQLNFKYNNNQLKSEEKLNNCFVTLTKVFNYNMQAEIYKLAVTNTSSKNINVKFGFANVWEKQDRGINIFYCKNKKMFFENKNLNKWVMFAKFFSKVNITNGGVCFLKQLKLKGQESYNFYFIKFLNINSFNNFNCNLVLSNLFEDTLKLYKNLFKIKVLSCNKNLNNLINIYLPNKIIEEQLLSKNNILCKNFNNLLFNNYSNNLVSKTLISVPISNFYLLKDNFFKVYFNLIFFYFGVWPSKNNSVVLNQDKSLILQNSTVVFNLQGKHFFVKHKKENLQNEVKINNITYSNLKMLNCNSFLEAGQNKLEILF